MPCLGPRLSTEVSLIRFFKCQSWTLPSAFSAGCWEQLDVKGGKCTQKLMSAKGKMLHQITDFSSWALPAGMGRAVNRSLWFCQSRARSNGELSYGKRQCGDRGGAGVPGSVEGSAGQPAAKGCSQLLDSSCFPKSRVLVPAWTLCQQGRHCPGRTGQQ